MDKCIGHLDAQACQSLPSLMKNGGQIPVVAFVKRRRNGGAVSAAHIIIVHDDRRRGVETKLWAWRLCRLDDARARRGLRR